MYIVVFTLAICSLVFTKTVFAEQYQLKLMGDLTRLNAVSTDAVWLDPLASPVDGKFFVAQANGVIYLLGKDEPNSQDAILNLPLDSNMPAFIALTAISFHPSFTLPEEPGYATFYTAHTTEFEQQKYTNRVTLNDTNIDFAFETVITAWTYDFDKQKIEPETQREILRIPITSRNNAIEQLTFEPYLKPWNTDFGQLYFSLSYINELKHHALYSGVILRISPLMFGARNYTVSQSNPFIKAPEINNEIVVMGAANIKHFFWAKNSYESIFIQHNNGVLHWLSQAKVGVNLQVDTESDLLWQQAKESSSMLLYQGRNFLNLRNKMIFFTLIDNQWNLASRALESLNGGSPTFEEVIATPVISPRAVLTIHQNNENEPIIFDHHQGKLYSLQLANTLVAQTNISQANTSDSNGKYFVVIISLLAALLGVSFFIRRNKAVSKLAVDPLDNNYVRFEYVLTNDTILLYRINHQKEFKTLSLNDIIRCEVLLNSVMITTIDGEPENVISNQIEEHIRAIFMGEQNEKMEDEQTRQIEIILSDKDSSYTICLYLRKGNNRVTGLKYYRVIDMLVELCWVISKRLSPQLTETRIVPVVTFSRPNLVVSPKQINEAQTSRKENFIKSNKKPARFIPTDPKPEVPKPADQPTHQTEVVAALEKLVDLHKQGYLSDEEFSLAKTNLLQ